MFDVGVSCQSFCLAAWELGLGTVIMGVFDEDGISRLIGLPEAPKRKTVGQLLQYR